MRLSVCLPVCLAVCLFFVCLYVCVCVCVCVIRVRCPRCSRTPRLHEAPQHRGPPRLPLTITFSSSTSTQQYIPFSCYLIWHKVYGHRPAFNLSGSVVAVSGRKEWQL